MPGTAEIRHHEPQRAPDGRVCAEARPETPHAAMETDFMRVRTVDEEERRACARCRLQQREIEALLQHTLHRADQNRHVSRLAACHNCVQRDGAHRSGRHERRHQADQRLRIPSRRGEHGGKPLLRGRDDRQSV